MEDSEAQKCINNLNKDMAINKQRLKNIEEKLERVPTKEGMELSNEKLLNKTFKKMEVKIEKQRQYAKENFAKKRIEPVVYLIGSVLLALVITITLVAIFGQDFPINIGI